MAGEIIVPLDGSALASQALPYAAYLARRCQAGVLLVHAVAGPFAAESAAVTDQLAAVARDLRAQGVPVSVEVRHGPPVHATADLVRTRAAPLLVMATHGRSGTSPWVLGSTAERLLQACRVPALLLTPAALAGGTPDRLAGRVIVPVDGSELSRCIYPVVTCLARALGAPITLVRVVEPAAVWAVSGDGHPIPADNAALLPGIEASLRRGLAQRAREWQAEDLEVSAVVSRGDAASAIAAVAAAQHAGWLAMAGHGQGGLGGQSVGRTTKRVLQDTTLPVLLATWPHRGRYRIGAVAEQLPC